MEMVAVMIVAALGGIVAYLNLRGRHRRRRDALGYSVGTTETKSTRDASRGDRADDSGSDGGGDGGGD